MTWELKAEIWVKALIRRASSAGVPAVVVRRGDASAGVVLVKVNRLNGEAAVFGPARDGDGRRIWVSGLSVLWSAEADADAYIGRQLSFDPDLWVVEVEDREGRHFIEGDVRL